MMASICHNLNIVHNFTNLDNISFSTTVTLARIMWDEKYNFKGIAGSAIDI